MFFSARCTSSRSDWHNLRCNQVYDHNRFVQDFYYQLEPEFQSQLDEWYNTMAVPTVEEILDRLS